MIAIGGSRAKSVSFLFGTPLMSPFVECTLVLSISMLLGVNVIILGSMVSRSLDVLCPLFDPAFALIATLSLLSGSPLSILGWLH